MEKETTYRNYNRLDSIGYRAFGSLANGSYETTYRNYNIYSGVGVINTILLETTYRNYNMWRLSSVLSRHAQLLVRNNI